jgi:GNAT superfamily N-acetyltransferase
MGAPNPQAIERASPSDAAALTEVAHQAKGHWDYPQPWMEAWKADLTVSQDYILNHPVFAIRLDGRPAAFYALAPFRSGPFTWELDHLWVAPRVMGRGWGRALVDHAMDQARRLGAAHLRILSDPHAEAFYRRLGAVPVRMIPAPVAGEDRWLPELRLSLVSTGLEDTSAEPL